MRPGYIEAVKAVSTGWSYWIIYILPACVIWLSVLFCPFRSKGYRILFIGGAFLLAGYLYVDRVWIHVNRIQSIKEANMQTEEEKQDWASDTGRVFAPVFAIPISFVYCTINLIVAVTFRIIIKRTFRNSRLSESNNKATKDRPLTDNPEPST